MENSIVNIVFIFFINCILVNTTQRLAKRNCSLFKPNLEGYTELFYKVMEKLSFVNTYKYE